MHDLEFNHMHMAGGDAHEGAWDADHVELRTVGIDIGSSTSHLIFARVHLQRLGSTMSSRFAVAGRKVLWQSPILLAPYLQDNSIDIQELSAFIASCYRYAGLEPVDIDSGAVILTGEAIKRVNSAAIATMFSEDTGHFVCASAGHHMECQLAAHGSGAVALSRGHAATLINVDIGGGTTKLALIDQGRILATVALAVGARLLVERADGSLIRIDDPAKTIADSLDVALSTGRTLDPGGRARLVARMVRLILRMIDRRMPDELTRRLLLTDFWPRDILNKGVDALTFSGGVSEYLYKRETRRFGDLGVDLARELAHMLANRRDLPPIWDPGQGIRATAIGASQFTAQVSGNTILIRDHDLLPLQNLPVLACTFELADVIEPESIAASVRVALARGDVVDGESPVALAFEWKGLPSHARLHAVAKGICAALPGTLAAGAPLILMIDGDVAMSIGRVMMQEVAANVNLIALDGVSLKEFDYVDVGAMIEATHVVPVVIKSLLFN